MLGVRGLETCGAAISQPLVCTEPLSNAKRRWYHLGTPGSFGSAQTTGLGAAPVRCEAAAETLPWLGHGRGVSLRHRPHMGGPLCATTLIPSCYHAQPLMPPHLSPCLEASPRPRSHPSEARGLDVAHHRPLGTIPQGRRARHRPVCHHGGPRAAFPAPPPALPRAPRWPRLRRGPIDFGMTKAWITKVRSASERKGRRLLASSS